MTKAQIKKALQAAIDHAHSVSKQRITDMESQKHNPQVALMIEKNRGYMMACEDITDLLYSLKIF